MKSAIPMTEQNKVGLLYLEIAYTSDGENKNTKNSLKL